MPVHIFCCSKALLPAKDVGLKLSMALLENPNKPPIDEAAPASASSFVINPETNMSSINLDCWLSYSLIAKSRAAIISFLLISCFSSKLAKISCCDVAIWPLAFVYPSDKASMLSFPDSVKAFNSDSFAVCI